MHEKTKACFSLEAVIENLCTAHSSGHLTMCLMFALILKACLCSRDNNNNMEQDDIIALKSPWGTSEANCPWKISHTCMFSGDSKRVFKNYVLCSVRANEQGSRYEAKLLHGSTSFPLPDFPGMCSSV